MKKLAGAILLAAAIAASGCTGTQNPEIQTGKDEISIQGNETAQLEVQNKNIYKEKAASFQLNATAPEIVDVLNSESEQQESFNMGEASSGSKTVKKVLLVRGNPGKLGSLNSGTDKIQLDVMAETSGNLTEAEKTASKNVTVTVEK